MHKFHLVTLKFRFDLRIYYEFKRLLSISSHSYSHLRHGKFNTFYWPHLSLALSNERFQMIISTHTKQFQVISVRVGKFSKMFEIFQLLRENPQGVFSRVTAYPSKSSQKYQSKDLSVVKIQYLRRM